jgi:hypothetical protein
MTERFRQRSHRRARLFAALLGIGAILAHALLPVLHPVPTPQAVLRLLADAAAGPATAVICTPAGIKVVALDGLPAEPDGKPGKARFCPLCQAAGAMAAFAPPVTPALAAPAGAAVAAIRVAAAAVPRQPATANLPPRAPPLPIG